MLIEFQTMLGLFQSFLFVVLIGSCLLIVVASLALNRANIGSNLISWYGIFLFEKKRNLFLITMLFLRLFYVISFLWMAKQLHIVHFIVYCVIELVIAGLVFQLNYILYLVVHMGIQIGLIYLYSLLFVEVSKVEVKPGMPFLYYGFGVLLVASAVIQFLITILHNYKNMKHRTESELVVKKHIWFAFASFLLAMMLPFYIIKSVSYITVPNGGYQIEKGVHIRYPKKSKVSLEDTTCIIEYGNESAVLLDTPLYFCEESKMLITKPLSIVRPKLEATNRINRMDALTWEGANYQVVTHNKSIGVEDFFLFDGKDTYYLPKDTTIDWEGHTFVVSSLCQVEVTYNSRINIFDLETEEYESYETGNELVIATLAGKERVNLSTDILYRKGDKEQMLFLQPSLLDDLE